jgi:hypothetical protein
VVKNIRTRRAGLRCTGKDDSGEDDPRLIYQHFGRDAVVMPLDATPVRSSSVTLWREWRHAARARLPLQAAKQNTVTRDL